MYRKSLLKKSVASIVAFSLALTVWAPAMQTYVSAKASAALPRKDSRVDQNYVYDVYLHLEKMARNIIQKHSIPGFDPKTVTLSSFLLEAKKPERQNKDPLLKDALISLNHEAYAATNGHYGKHKNGTKGKYGDIHYVAQFIANNKPDWVRRLLYQGGKETKNFVTALTPKPQTPASNKQNPKANQRPQSTQNNGSGTKIQPQGSRSPVAHNRSPVRQQKTATSADLVKYLGEVLSSPKTFKGYCEATTIKQFTTSKKCSPDPAVVKKEYPGFDEQKIQKIILQNKNLYRTINNELYRASSGRCGFDDKGVPGTQNGESHCHNIWSLNPQNLSDKQRNQSFGGMLATLTLGAYNAYTSCLLGGYSAIVCTSKNPDEITRSFLQKTALTPDGQVVIADGINRFLPKNMHINPKDKFTNVFVTFSSQIGPVFIFHWATNQFLLLSQKNTMLAKVVSSIDINKALITKDITLKIAGVGAGIVATLQLCDALGANCSKELDYQNADDVLRFKSMLVVIAWVVGVFCFKSYSKECVSGIFANITTEFAIMHYGTPRAKCLFCPVSQAGTIQSAGIHFTYATGVLMYIRDQLQKVKAMKWDWASNLLKKTPNLFQVHTSKIGATISSVFQKTPIPSQYQKLTKLFPPKYQALIIATIALVFGAHNGGKYAIDLLVEYEEHTKKSNCKQHVSCAISMIRSIRNIQRDSVLSFIMTQSVELSRLLNKDEVAKKEYQSLTSVAASDQGLSLKLVDPILWVNFNNEIARKLRDICDYYATPSRATLGFDSSNCNVTS